MSSGPARHTEDTQTPAESRVLTSGLAALTAWSLGGVPKHQLPWGLVEARGFLFLLILHRLVLVIRRAVGPQLLLCLSLDFDAAAPFILTPRA